MTLYIKPHDNSSKVLNIFSVNIIGFSDPFEVTSLKDPENNKEAVFFLIWYSSNSHNNLPNRNHTCLHFSKPSIFLVLFTEETLLNIGLEKISILYFIRINGFRNLIYREVSVLRTLFLCPEATFFCPEDTFW